MFVVESIILAQVGERTADEFETGGWRVNHLEHLLESPAGVIRMRYGEGYGALAEVEIVSRRRLGGDAQKRNERSGNMETS